MRKVRLLKQQIEELEARIEQLQNQRKEEINRRVSKVEEYGNILYGLFDLKVAEKNPRVREAFAWLDYCKRKHLLKAEQEERQQEIEEDIARGIEPWQLVFKK